MGKVWRTIGNTLMILFIFALVFSSGYFMGRRLNENQALALAEEAAALPETEEKPDLELPGEVEKRVVTVEEVEVKLVEIGQFSTYSSEYTVSKSADYSRYFLEEYEIPGTTNSITINCRGIVKVGYEVKDIIPIVDNETMTISISLPAPAVLDNYVIWDSVNYDETNNILNPIDFAQYHTLVAEIEALGLAQAEAAGVYAIAEENIKLIIQNFLAGFADYEIVFK